MGQNLTKVANAPNSTHFIKDKLTPLSRLDLLGCIVDKREHVSKMGGYSDVYSAWSTKHDKKVAVKQVASTIKK